MTYDGGEELANRTGRWRNACRLRPLIRRDATGQADSCPF